MIAIKALTGHSTDRRYLRKVGDARRKTGASMVRTPSLPHEPVFLARSITLHR